ncbi:hypothetical protein [Simkania negevensis]|uniref:Uncharacterized protein n=1 Tax=Simkania negevensis (strain ATCC VR-1471 / DSM 27360 / Z) TaxID=331113 RepID=F8L2T2_SIMNZ|nr:hypothetical protein [Simkania negevensis]CCB87778.1 unknown protein [Simkania negevensis Z]
MSDKEEFVKVTVNMSKGHHRKLKAIAAIKGIGLSNYIMDCIEKVALRQKDGVGEHLEDDAIKEVEELIENQS